MEIFGDKFRGGREEGKGGRGDGREEMIQEEKGK